MDSKEKCKSWFCVLNNPQEIYTGEPSERAQQCLDEWITDHPTRTGAVAYCVSADGLIHLHMVLEDSSMARFSTLKNTYPKAHLEPTKGTKEQAEDYIHKRGKFEEKGESVLYIAQYGEIKGYQGQRKDLEIIEELLEQGKTPSEIFDISFRFRRYDKMIKQAYYDKRLKETSEHRKVTVYWHCGESGSGKTYVYVKLCEQHGRDNVYLLTDYDKGGFDNYNGQSILCMDEFRGQIRFSFLMQYLDGYLSQIPCRYSNGFALWTEVHIFTVMPPEMVYRAMISENQNVDTYEQLKRRIDFVVYHYKQGNEYKTYEELMSEYVDYERLKNTVLRVDSIENSQKQLSCDDVF